MAFWTQARMHSLGLVISTDCGGNQTGAQFSLRPKADKQQCPGSRARRGHVKDGTVRRRTRVASAPSDHRLSQRIAHGLRPARTCEQFCFAKAPHCVVTPQTNMNLGELSMKPIMSLLALAMLGLAGTLSADNGVIESKFDFDFVMPAPCLGENVLTKIFVTARNHAFSTPSGNYHALDKWQFTLVGVGESTGREWAGRGVSPGGDNVTRNGEKFFFTESGLMRPISVPGLDDGPWFRFNHVYQVRWDADGNLVMEMAKGFDPNVRCLGKN